MVGFDIVHAKESGLALHDSLAADFGHTHEAKQVDHTIVSARAAESAGVSVRKLQGM